MRVFDASHYFSSAARAKVLEALIFQEKAIPLRHVQYISDLDIRAVELTLKDLQRERLVRRKKQGNRVLFLPNDQHPHHQWIKEMLLVARKAQITGRVVSYTKHVSEALAWAEQAVEWESRIEEKKK